MATEIRNLLPIGTVVSLTGAEKRLMIYGIKQMDLSNEKEYDYVGVIYPEGNLGGEMQFLFNHEDINAIYFIGYEDAERQMFINELANSLESSDDSALTDNALSEESSSANDTLAEEEKV